LFAAGGVEADCIDGDVQKVLISLEAPVAKRSTRRSAKPVFAGSIPARRSKLSRRKKHDRIGADPLAIESAGCKDLHIVALVGGELEFPFIAI
jgi:hypothetical protein